MKKTPELSAMEDLMKGGAEVEIESEGSEDPEEEKPAKGNPESVLSSIEAKLAQLRDMLG